MENEGEQTTIRLILVDDQPIVRSGLMKVLNDEPTIQVIAEANGYEDLFAHLRKSELNGEIPDVILLDQSKVGTHEFEILRELRKYYPSVKVLILSLTVDDTFAVRVVRAGAAGYISKESAIEELVTAIHQVHERGRYITPDLAKKLIDSLDLGEDRPKHEILSNRELQVLSMIAIGKKMREIAEQLSLSPATVATYRARILEKMKLKSNVELASYAVRHHLID